jgi:hypothetical protein
MHLRTHQLRQKCISAYTSAAGQPAAEQLAGKQASATATAAAAAPTLLWPLLIAHSLHIPLLCCRCRSANAAAASTAARRLTLPMLLLTQWRADVDGGGAYLLAAGRPPPPAADTAGQRALSPPGTVGRE